MELDQLLFGKRAVDARHKPFFYGCVDNYFPAGLYDDLLATFPAETTHINYRRGSRFALGDNSPAEHDFFAERPGWKAVLEFYSSPDFLADLQSFLEPAVQRDRGESTGRRWQYTTDWHSHPGGKDVMPVKITFKFAHGSGNYSLLPHTDRPFKLFSIVLYFPEPGWIEEYGGGTVFYSPKYSLLKRNWNDEFAPFSLMECRETFSYLHNRMVYLLKSANSWHGLAPIRSPAPLSRRSVLISFHAQPHDYREHWRSVARWHTRQCIRALSWVENRKQNA